jgi:uncharacterized protein
VRACLLVALVIGGLSSPAIAFDDAALARQSYEKIIVPGYAAFADASNALAGKAGTLCASPSTTSLAETRDAARAALLAFGRVEVIRFGPIAQKQRQDRLLFYPDAHGIVAKQTAKLLAKKDAADIDAEKLAGASVAVQGFGALDVALYGRGSEQLGEPGPEASFRCGYIKALTADIAQIARETLDEWKGEYGKLWLSPGGDNKTYLSAKETTQALYRAYVTQLEVLRMQRLAAVSGPDAKPAGPLLPNSGLALPFVLAGIEGERAVLGESGFTAPNLASGEKEEAAVAMLGSVETDLGFALRAGEAAAAMTPDAFKDDAARERLTPMLLSLKNAEDIGRAALGDLTGQTLGFNSLDGD